MVIFEVFKYWALLKIFRDNSLPPSSSSPPIPELCDDVLFNILLRLPPDVLARFSCVNKRAHSMVNDPEFLRKYRSQHHLLAGLFYQDEWCNQTGFIRLKRHDRNVQCIDQLLSFLPPSRVRILASHHGLLLCSSMTLDRVHYYVCNPLTRGYTMLPERNLQGGFSTGLLVDRESGHYQVVRIPKSGLETKGALVETFSSETGKWRLLKLNISFDYWLYSTTLAAVQFDESLYWAIMFGSILTYDVREEKFMSLEVPYVPLQDELENEGIVIKNGCLGVSSGLLSYAYVDANFLYVWIREGEHWVLTRKVTLWHIKINNEMVFQNLESFQVHIGQDRSVLVKPAGFHEFDSNFMFFKLPECIISYNFQDGKIDLLQFYSSKLKVETVFPYVLPHFLHPVEFQHLNTLEPS